MALATAPSTPERTGLPPSIRRSFTAPTNSCRSAIPIPQSPGEGAETLYAHTACKIISFSHTSSTGRRHSSVSDGRAEFQEHSSGSSPWASATERTIAAGLLRIYRVLGSVAFLSSGGTLQPILPKSQCWCVDGESKFVLRIRPNSYYRIELPFRTMDDKIKAEEMKDVLAKILQYEMTPCPFQRGFTVALPELPQTPLQKRPWRPKTKLASTPEHLAEELESFDFGKGSSRSKSPAIEESDNPELAVPSEQKRGNGRIISSDVSIMGSENEDSDATDGTEVSVDQPSNDTLKISPQVKTPTRPHPLRTGRATTAPPHLTLRTSGSSPTALSMLSSPEANEHSPSLSSSMESFHSFHSPISPLAPSPPFSEVEPLTEYHANGLDVPRVRGHRREESEVTITADPSRLWDMGAQSSEDIVHHFPLNPPSTPPLIDDAASEEDEHWSEAVTPSPTKGVRQRKFLSKKRSHSPLPPSANLYSPYSPRTQMSGHHLTTAILQRTCSLLLGPPVQLVALMLRIAAKLAHGTFRGSSFGFGEGGQKIPCSWDFSDGSDDNDEDDYGVPLSRPTSRVNRSKESTGSWEID